jgi:hypothetical protein
MNLLQNGFHLGSHEQVLCSAYCGLLNSDAGLSDTIVFDEHTACSICPETECCHNSEDPSMNVYIVEWFLGCPWHL